MFISFLNKSDPHCLDLSVLTTYPPEKVLFYYLSSVMTVPLDYYQSLKESLTGDDQPSSAVRWITLFEEVLGAAEDIQLLRDNVFLDYIGPFYYPVANTRIYFCKSLPPQAEIMFAHDLAVLENLHDVYPPEPTVQAYARNRKGTRRFTRNKEEIIKDVKMCMLAINQMERLHKQINFWKKIETLRQNILDGQDFLPAAPDYPPIKPEKPGVKARGKLLIFSRQKNRSDDRNAYQHQLKIYYIRYREYEKACDRFKEVLENWPDLQAAFYGTCDADYANASDKLFYARQYLELYEQIIVKSMVHSDYQDTKTLGVFLSYLETGRANDLQECMNLYEEECIWNELKAGQTRIENTIYLLQNDNAHVHMAQAHLNQLLQSEEKVEKSQQEV